MAGGRSRVIVWALAGAISFWASGMAVSVLSEDEPLLLLTLLPLVGPSVCFAFSLGNRRTTGRIAAQSIAMLLAIRVAGP